MGREVGVKVSAHEHKHAVHNRMGIQKLIRKVHVLVKHHHSVSPVT